jgi:hypothetical protein
MSTHQSVVRDERTLAVEYQPAEPALRPTHCSSTYTGLS